MDEHTSVNVNSVKIITIFNIMIGSSIISSHSKIIFKMYLDIQKFVLISINLIK